MKKLIYFLPLLAFNAFCQDFNPKYLQLPENPKKEDFSFLKDELKDTKIVLLGELSHFDGNVFEMKTKIVEYLHNEMGFNTIAFESGIYDVWKANKNIKNGEKTQLAFENSLFTIWAKKNEFQSFITFYDTNKNNLKLFGFDNQITGKYGEEELFIDLYTYCEKNSLSFKLNKTDLELLFESMQFSGVFDEGDITYTQFYNTFSELVNNIDKLVINEENYYWKQIIKSLLIYGEYYQTRENTLSAFNTTSDDNLRDKQMADNSLSYIKKNPNEKIICWGANQHFTNDVSSIKAPIIKDFKPMGSYIKEVLKEKTYSLASISAKDSIYLQNSWEITPIEKNSFEYHLKKMNKNHIFISSNQKEMQQKMLNRLFSPTAFIEARIDLLHDGYLYFNTTTPSTTFDKNENKIIANNFEKNVDNTINTK